MLRSIGAAVTTFLIGAVSLMLAAAGVPPEARGAIAGELSAKLGRPVRPEARASVEPGDDSGPASGEALAQDPREGDSEDLLIPRVPSTTRGIAKALDGDVALGDHLGAGSDKVTYTVKGDPDLAISIVNRRPGKTLDEEFDVLASEASQLRILARAGVPVVDVVAYGTFDGHAAVITKRYATGMKAPDFKDEGYRFLNEQSIRDLEHIRDVLRARKIVVRDLQFLIDKDGRVVVADPLRIFGTDTDPHIPGFKTLTRFHEMPRNLHFMEDMARRSIEEERDGEMR